MELFNTHEHTHMSVHTHTCVRMHTHTPLSQEISQQET